jgi:hypothetical protein
MSVAVINPPAMGALFSIYPKPNSNTAIVEITKPQNLILIPGAKLSLFMILQAACRQIRQHTRAQPK